MFYYFAQTYIYVCVCVCVSFVATQTQLRSMRDSVIRFFFNVLFFLIILCRHSRRDSVALFWIRQMCSEMKSTNSWRINHPRERWLSVYWWVCIYIFIYIYIPNTDRPTVLNCTVKRQTHLNSCHCHWLLNNSSARFIVLLFTLRTTHFSFFFFKPEWNCCERLTQLA